MLAVSRDNRERCYARHARGIALREIGDVRGALRELRRALGEAATLGPGREADVEASLGGTLAYAGRGAEALAVLASALDKSRGVAAARVRVRRGLIYLLLGRPDDALADLRAAARVLRHAGDSVWESRARINLAEALLDLGRTGRADAELARVEALQHAAEQPFEAAIARQSRGTVATLEGRIPDALAHYDVAEEWFRAAGERTPYLCEMRAAALLAAGLFTDALDSAEEAVELLRLPGASPAYLAQALVRAADTALAVENPTLARRRAEEALRLFRRQGRERGAVLAGLSLVRARVADGERSRRLLSYTAQVAAEAGRRRMAETVEAHLLAGQLALDLGDLGFARGHLDRAAAGRASRADLSKVLGWQATALRAEATGRASSLLRACDRGLQVLDGYQATLGAIETRAAVTTHGLALARLALARAVDTGDAALMLRWVERWRSTTFRLPPIRSVGDDQLGRELAQLRRARSRLDDAALAGQTTTSLQADVAAREAALRRRTLRARTEDPASPATIDVPTLVAALGAVTLVELFVLDQTMHALVIRASQIRHHVVGPVADAERAISYVAFALRRMTHRSTGDRARATLPALCAALEQSLLGPAVADLDTTGSLDTPGATPSVVVVPPAALAAAPWGLLPVLTARVTSVAPSATAWLATRTSSCEDVMSGRVTVVAGPGLRHADAEAHRVASMYPKVNLLDSTAARTRPVLTALDGASLAHVAAHGTFRADNPMFSAVQLADGPLTVFDLQRLQRAPRQLVLSCCDTGAVSAAGADEMLGLLSALIPLGTAGLLAAAVPVSDEASEPFAVGVHERLQAGVSLAEALRDARRAAGSVDGNNPAGFAVAHSFLAFGAA